MYDVFELHVKKWRTITTWIRQEVYQIYYGRYKSINDKEAPWEKTAISKKICIENSEEWTDITNSKHKSLLTSNYDCSEQWETEEEYSRDIAQVESDESEEWVSDSN